MYKVVTDGNMSLGLRNNPTPLLFPINEWIEDERKEFNNKDSGGIWVCDKLSNAKRLKKYYESRYGKALIYKCEIGEILYQNNYRLKTNKVKLLHVQKD